MSDLREALAQTADQLRQLRLRVTRVRDDRVGEVLETTLELKIAINTLDLVTRLAQAGLAHLCHDGRPAEDLADIELQVAAHRGRLAEAELRRRLRARAGQ